MKFSSYHIYLFFFITLLSAYGAKIVCTDLLVVVLMVKNEESVIANTLRPFTKAGISSFLILDTGSTDNTIQEAKRFFLHERVKNWYIAEKPFVDYSTSRNYALELAERYFSATTFVLMIDAEWYVEGISELLQFCENNKLTSESCFNIWIRNGKIDFQTTRLFKMSEKIRFKYRVHEIPTKVSSKTVSRSCCIHYNPEQKGLECSQKRLLRDKMWLEKDHYQYPRDNRILFMLARTCQALKQNKEAIFYYKKFIYTQDITEYAFYSYYMLGTIFDSLLNWKKALYYYEQANHLCNHRIEPLVKIAHYYLQKGDYKNAHRYLLTIKNVPFPLHDVLFVERSVYEYERYELLSITCAQLHQLELGLWAVNKALQMYPQDLKMLSYKQWYHSFSR